MTSRAIACLTLLGALAVASIGSAATAAEAAAYLDELTRLTVGSFTTIEQARRDPRYAVAEAEIVRIWPDRDDGHWLYQEQALLGERPADIDPGMKAKPYFARVIRSVEVAPGVVERTVHRLKEPARALGAWKTKAPLAGLTPDDLEPSECRIRAERVAEGMWRSQSEQCPNAYKGASYAVSLGVSLDGRYANWDRGFAADGSHVWGPASGGYIFIRKNGRGGK